MINAASYYWDSESAAGSLNTTLHRHQQEEKSIQIDWSPASAGCIEFVTGLWIKIYELGIRDRPSTEPYLTIPRKCLKSKHEALSGKEYLSILLPSSNSSFQNATDDPKCSFLIKTLVDCHTYYVDVVPEYQSLRGIPIRNDITIPPTVGLLNMFTCLHAKKNYLCISY